MFNVVFCPPLCYLCVCFILPLSLFYPTLLLFDCDREKEKSENKDRKVLEILNNKDNKIDELQQIVSEQSEQMRSLIARSVHLCLKASQIKISWLKIFFTK